ncbi:MAG TPA: hypothetical protein VJC05_02555, partial [Candidatus Andersenbacteria bacterium]|nr:hypothetical protein [Candidatus Andersenbacteria bacterium]
MINVSFRNEFSWALIVVMAGAVISLALSLQAGLFFMFFAAAAWWTWEHPWDGFTFFIIIAPLLPMFKITQTIGTVTLIKDVIILTLFAKLFLFPLLQKTLPYRRNMLFAPVVTLALWALFSLLRADSLLLGVLRARDIGLYALLYFAVLYLPRSTKRWRETASWFAASVVVVLLLAIYQWFFAVDSAVLRFDPVRDIWIPRLSSIMAHPSIFGQYLVLAALLGAAIAWHTRGRTRMTAALLAAATVPFIFLTYSRGVWIGFILGIGAMALVVLARAALNKVRGPQVWRWAG